MALAGKSLSGVSIFPIPSQIRCRASMSIPIPLTTFPFTKLKNLNTFPIFHSNPPSFLHNSASVAKANPTAESQTINTTTTTTSGTTWSEFARNVSGEWDGFGADFTTKGNPVELPESVVPEAYREWEVKVFDWQTQCPTLAQPDDSIMVYKTIKLLPTVGCEADATTRYSIDEKNVGGVDNKVSAFAYQSSGSYVAVWPTGGKQLELEHCLINPQDRESRVRVIQVVCVDDSKISLENVRVFCEQWYGPFRNGDQLGGCAIRDSAFASTTPLKASDVVGVWQGSTAVASFDDSQSGFVQEVLDGSMQKSVRDECGILLLPKQLWCSVKGGNDGETLCEVGWLFDHGHAVTSKCTFSSNTKLKEISIGHQTAILEGV